MSRDRPHISQVENVFIYLLKRLDELNLEIQQAEEYLLAEPSPLPSQKIIAMTVKMNLIAVSSNRIHLNSKVHPQEDSSYAENPGEFNHPLLSRCIWDVFDRLIRLLASPHREIQLPAALSLDNLTQVIVTLDHRLPGWIESTDIFDRIKELIDSANPCIRESIAKMLVVLLDSKVREVKRKAVCALNEFTLNVGNQKIIAKIPGALNRLAKFFLNDNWLSPLATESMLANLGHNTNNLKMIIEVPGVFKLLKESHPLRMQNQESASTRARLLVKLLYLKPTQEIYQRDPFQYAVHTLYHMIYRADNNSMTDQVRCEFDRIIVLLAAPMPVVQTGMHIKLLAKDPSFLIMISQVEGGFNHLVGLLASRNHEVQQAALHTLSCLSYHAHNQSMIGLVAGVFDHLVELLNSEYRFVQRKASIALTNLASHVRSIVIPNGLTEVDWLRFGVLKYFKNLKEITIHDRVIRIEQDILKDLPPLRINATSDTYNRLHDCLPKRIYDIKTLNGDEIEYHSLNPKFLNAEFFIGDLPEQLQQQMLEKGFIHLFDKHTKVQFSMAPGEKSILMLFSRPPDVTDDEKKEALLIIYQKSSWFSKKTEYLNELSHADLISALRHSAERNPTGASGITLEINNWVIKNNINIIHFLEYVRVKPHYLDEILAEILKIDTDSTAAAASGGGGASFFTQEGSTGGSSAKSEPKPEGEDDSESECLIM